MRAMPLMRGHTARGELRWQLSRLTVGRSQPNERRWAIMKLASSFARKNSIQQIARRDQGQVEPFEPGDDPPSSVLTQLPAVQTSTGRWGKQSASRMRVQSITVPLPRLLSLNGGAIDRPKNVPDGLPAMTSKASVICPARDFCTDLTAAPLIWRAFGLD
jgi:hypothetical protein